MMLQFKKIKFLQSHIVLNGAWGAVSSVFQILFVCLFFAILARKYEPDVFAHFLIASTVYQLVAAFSTMGLSQWFVRAYINENDKVDLTSKFLKTQLGLGTAFYLINIIFAFVLYPEGEIRLLCIVLGTNVIFDNFIIGIKSLNIAESKQKKTAIIMLIDGFFKLLVGCILFVYPLSILTISIILILVRVLTLSLFIKLGSSNNLKLYHIYKAKVLVNDLKEIVLKNWQFIIIGSVSIVYWRLGNIIISKTLSLSDVADYELSFRIFSVFQIIPLVASSTVYPRLIEFVKDRKFSELKDFYQKAFWLFSVFALVSYYFIYSFSDVIIPFAFGNGYPSSIVCLDQMFLTFLLLPTVLLQANVIVALGMEKFDMWLNLISLFLYVLGCFIGFYFVKSLAVINYSIFISFIAFHLLQDIILIRKGIANLRSCAFFYVSFTVAIMAYHSLFNVLNHYLLFFLFIISLGLLTYTYILIKGKFTNNKVLI